MPPPEAQRRWAGLPAAGALTLGQSPDLPRFLALPLLALARVHRNGHAPFAPGELRELLARPDTTTGELLDAHPSSVSRAIREAKTRGLIAPASSARCIVLVDALHTYGTGSNSVPRCGHD
ncbi:hypothetical protein [Litorihabitans aurantiacus]|uniref:Uncharacterized protein n=1 Tax=Litorihabitans aurantiacus TaxID=1930061 RepID=A0AA38CV80_9MICO|nr:hypothetical protein [Litorihabitans aurantiacus]GMA32575.1 hypothetical protein GCM10025875_25670 [Litorihabitans aurantiacus]